MCILRNNSSSCAHDGEQRNARRRGLAGAGEGAGSILSLAAGAGGDVRPRGVRTEPAAAPGVSRWRTPEGGTPLPAAGTGGQLLSEGSLVVVFFIFVGFFFCLSSPQHSSITRRREGAEISCESRELAGLEGSGVRGFPSRVAG